MTHAQQNFELADECLLNGQDFLDNIVERQLQRRDGLCIVFAL